jgi:N-methylhydantoinase A
VPLSPTGRSLAEAHKGRRAVDYAVDGVQNTDIYAGELLEPGMAFDGPAVVETTGTTIVIPPKSTVAIDDYGNTVIALTPHA